MRLAYIGPITVNKFQKYFIDTIPMSYESNIYIPYIEHLLEQGHHMTICTTSLYINKVFELHNDNMSIFIIPVSKYGKIRAFTKWKRSIQLMSKCLERSNCDIYHANWTYEFALAALKVNRERTLITVHDSPETIYEINKDYYRKKRLEMAIKVFEKGKYFTGVSPYIINEVRKNHNIPNITMIPNLLKVKSYENIEMKKNTIITINNGFDNRKNTKTLLYAFNKINRELPMVNLKMFGSAYGIGEKAYNWAIANHLERGVEFCGLQKHEDICKNMKESQFLIHSSLEESFGMTLIEAMFYGTVVIAGNNSGAVPWVLENGKSGCLVDVSKADEISINFIRLYKDKIMQQKYIENGYKRVEDFAVEKITSEYMQVFENMILEECGESKLV